MQPFSHLNAATAADAVSRKGVKSMVIAGGTDCLGILKNRVLPLYPELLINIKTIPGLGKITEDAAGLRIGALATLSELIASPRVAGAYGLLAEAARSVASPQIQNMGTLGGNLCQDVRCWYYRCSPLTGRDYYCRRKGGKECFAVKGDNRYNAIMGGKGCFAVCPSDMAVALHSLDATLTIQGKRRKRTVPIGEFYTVMGTVLAPDEIVREVRVPPPPNGARQRYIKFRLRKAIDFAIVSVASLITSEEGRCTDARITLGGVAPTPVRASAAEEEIRGKVLSEATAEKAARAALKKAKPLSMNAYKVEIAKTLVKRAILA